MDTDEQTSIEHDVPFTRAQSIFWSIACAAIAAWYVAMAIVQAS